jgi:hypothetical protein
MAKSVSPAKPYSKAGHSKKHKLTTTHVAVKAIIVGVAMTATAVDAATDARFHKKHKK